MFRQRRWRLFSSIAAVAAGAVTSQSGAQDIEPRAYASTPVGINFLIAGYVYSEGGVVTDAALPLEDAEIEVHGAVLAYVRSLDAWGRSSKLEFVLPYADVSGSATFAGELVTREVSGFGDPRVRFSTNLIGAPARALKDLAGQRPATTVGASLQVTIPAGQYDPTRLINIGSNRWAAKAELGLSKPLGALTAELAGGATFYRDNDEFFNGQTREQEAIYSLQAHLIYQLPRGMWGALGATWYSGGRTTVDGIEKDDRLESTRLGAALSLPLNQRHSIKLYASTGLSTRTGSDFDTIGITFQRRWGGGL